MSKDYLVVVKDNKIIEASYTLSLSEQRVLLACISQIDSKSTLQPDNKFHVMASEIVDLMGLDSSNAYRDMKMAVERLYNRTIKIDGEDGEMRWIYRKEYVKNEGKITLYFSPEIIPYLSQLSDKFTAYKLKYVTQFKSSYSIRLYEILVQWASAGEREVKVDWLRKIFQVEDKYKAIKDFKKYIVEPSLADINEHSNIWVEYGQRKSGRTVTHFQFKFGLKNQPKPRQQLTDADIEREARPGETRAAVIARLTGNSVAKDAKPGETFDQALQRKKELADVKRKLR
ncbi:RepB family plasmid replication initiator protein [Methylotuvimicrobium alcaliphilum]|uniref:Replication protein n=1 Tax=Methylotuvimicrobium alcaliphilum (strain DSM 19304 / NCIMB 14124 / VKM B-2133 / 20Z) TaxID=1091494 RepID=G4T4H5_META2|nr:RepB family plasmid replication initiator protein [Methylotuvimicrobium alcaliphilum]CCE25731.1 putative Replication protein [Methylotuvimicrobium alcaliphilum 20Z]